ncbi:MAG: hypothetical protein HY043_12065 [Verrucomicrobia bacterium]|nr:hypothetical protein [Verrucomicrobiota bacterium]
MSPRARPVGKAICLRVICQRPPRPGPHETGFGLQNKSLGDWQLHQGQTRHNGDLHFSCECSVKRDASSGSPVFLGPFVHGPATKRFLYLSWKPKNWQPGTREIVPPPYTRRMKVHLATISWPLLEAAWRAGAVLEVTVPGTAKDGGPACASVPVLEGGWKLGGR